MIKKNQKQFETTLQDNYEKYSKMTSEETLGLLKTSYDGLSEDEAEERKENYNKLHRVKEKKLNVFKLIYKSFINPFSLILLFIALLSFLTTYFIDKDGNYFSLFIILAIVVFSGCLRFIEEYRSNKSSSKLMAIVSNTTTVVRGNVKKEVYLEDITIGDILSLGSGDIIPGDIRILSSKDLFINESSLTGESIPVEKNEKYIKNKPLLNKNNIAYMGTNIISGTMVGVVVGIGKDTYLGGISLKNNRHQKTSFEKGINDISKLLMTVMVILVPCVFILNGLTKGDRISSFAFALTISVGLTPELLPMITTACLSRGSQKLAKKDVIIKNLNSINNFGAIDILCTDKTGTITTNSSYLDEVVSLSKSLSQDELVKIAYLNSFYQTGLKNNMDLAIINKFNEINKNNTENSFIKIDELPFDFSRKKLSVIIKDKTNNKCYMIVKGSDKEMIESSSSIYNDEGITPLNSRLIEHLIKKVEYYNLKGYRVLLLAFKEVEERTDFKVKDEKDLTILGLLAFVDPLKASAKEAINELKKYGVETKILTGDNEKVSMNIALSLGIKNPKILVGQEISEMDDSKLESIASEVNIFAKLSPDQKERIIIALKNSGHKVGFMGDGINDALALKRSDIGISVNDAVDIAKESADVILLKNDLRVLEQGIIEGRKTHYNMMKYIKITASSNFGNMFSLIFASLFLPFLPILPVHVLILNLIYDLTCSMIPFDNVDEYLLYKPVTFEAKSVKKFMFTFGPISSLFDISTYLVLFFIICPTFFSSTYTNIVDKEQFVMLFQSGWFIESLVTQILVIVVLRSKLSIFKSRINPFVLLVFAVSLGVVLGLIYTPAAKVFTLMGLPYYFYIYLLIVMALYLSLTSFIKFLYTRKGRELL